MPNITYIQFTGNFFNATNGQLPFSAISATTNISNTYPDNVILLIEEQNTSSGDDGFHFKSTTSVTFMILAWAFMLIGFTLCWCFQLFEKQKTQQELVERGRNERDGSGNNAITTRSRNESQQSGSQAVDFSPENGRCFVLDGDLDDIDSRTDRTNDALDPAEVIRRYDLDVESLPSYTIVSGLPTYDDALEEFRKAGLILKAPIPIVKIFDSDAKDSSSVDGLPEYLPPDNISTGSTCACGATTAIQPSQVIELNPEHLKILSQKRLSLQISFNAQPTIRRNSRPRVDLCQQVGRNNLLRAQRDLTPEMHRSSSMTFDNERTMFENRLRALEQHRGSIS